MDFNDKSLDGLDLTAREKKALSLFRKLGVKAEVARKMGLSRSTVRQIFTLIERKAQSADVLPLDVVEEHKIQRELKEAKAQIKTLTGRLEESENIDAFIRDLNRQSSKKPRWAVTPKGKTKERAIATAMLSDTHFDEVVSPAEVSGINAFNREIAVSRLSKFFQNTAKLSKDYINGIHIDGLVLAMGGDMVSGNIHDELARSNHAEIMDTVLFWSEQIIHGVDQLGGLFDGIHIPCVVGNHGRNSVKWRNKGAVQDNFDFLIYSLVARHFRGNKDITFDIPLDTNVRWESYKTRFNMAHGNEFRGGSGVGGVSVPILRGNYKKQQTAQAVNMPYDHLMIGHFHQYMDLGHVLMNGSLKGYDEYCRSNNFGYEPPRQMYFLTDPKHGKTISAPIHVQSSKERDLWDKYGTANQPNWLVGVSH